MLDNNKIVSLYDTEQKKLIGVFNSIELSAKYLFANYREKHVNRVSNALSRKHKIIEETIFEFPVAIRIANPIQVKLIGNDACMINHDYPQRMNSKGQIKATV